MSASRCDKELVTDETKFNFGEKCQGGDKVYQGGDNLHQGGDKVCQGGDNPTQGGDNLHQGGDNLQHVELNNKTRIAPH
ncbi:hypothetical protein [Sporosarcina limicola]|uniref:Uncharacterized protein n=1 Tax=Sporosarcina limicola TaxID=34101 RepID=A0A927R3L3_9BACL|nr:hypothetical protein [Sporosarcina limicola]MBE1555226.1 hypothetical protein [Sporosarcina limicola]